MKSNLTVPPHRTVIIDSDFKSKKIVVDVQIDGVETPLQQVFNLDVLPFDVVMSVICDMLTPRKPQSR